MYKLLFSNENLRYTFYNIFFIIIDGLNDFTLLYVFNVNEWNIILHSVRAYTL